MSDYEVGYGKPPKSGQFKHGQSGNQKGRPKGAKGLKTDLREELSERVTISENGKKKTLSKQRLILKALAQKAAKGDVKAAAHIVSLSIQMNGFEDQRIEKSQLSPKDQEIIDQITRDYTDEPNSEGGGSDDGND